MVRRYSCDEEQTYVVRYPMKTHAKWTVAEALMPYVESIFTILSVVAQDPNRSEALLRSAMGVIG